MTETLAKVDESRSDFEYEAGKALNLPTSIIELARKGEGYDHAFDSMNIMQPLNGWWAWWKKSRAALVVDIASHTEFEIEHMISPDKEGYSIGWIDGRNYSAEQVRAAGITVKGDSDGK